MFPNVDETIQAFWQLFIVDALLGNFDRHGANWGFLKKDNKANKFGSFVYELYICSPNVKSKRKKDYVKNNFVNFR